jgi:hypothetical protein
LTIYILFSKLTLVWPDMQNWRGHLTLPRSVWKIKDLFSEEKSFATCLLCNTEDEDIEHFLLRCSVLDEIRNSTFHDMDTTRYNISRAVVVRRLQNWRGHLTLPRSVWKIKDLFSEEKSFISCQNDLRVPSEMFHNVKLNKLWNNIDWPRKLIEFSASKPSPGGTGGTSAPPPLERCCTWWYPYHEM